MYLFYVLVNLLRYIRSEFVMVLTTVFFLGWIVKLLNAEKVSSEFNGMTIELGNGNGLIS